ncbi:hypothetical protein MJO28_000622 [Puccinia striiformis f. sp. tritici]|uniref:Uncharacterized protein n=1 Tax=Puccinia striiformis f. sp. tritici TaxID=168172 RepID=A0ACC0F182_9BASI|nr:hypothetical protein MJO28_000622 [Puccinia striiformis f. sp. tritici]
MAHSPTRKPASSPSTTRHLRKSKGASSNPTTPAPPTNDYDSYALQRGGQLLGSHGTIARRRSVKHGERRLMARIKLPPARYPMENLLSDQFGYETCKGCGGLKSMDRREMNICTKESCRSLPLHVSMRANHAPGCSTLVVPTEYSGHCDRCFKSMMCKACSWACTNQDCPYEVARQEIPYCGKCCAEHGMPIITQVDLKET